MLQLQLYIEGEAVELYKDESVTLNQSIQDIRDIEKVFTEYTRTFSVPASKINNKIFKHFYNYHIDGFDARRKQEADLHINYKPFKKGRVKLEGVTLKNNEPDTYKITFFGNTVTITDLIGEDRLGNLEHLREFNFTYNDTNIEAYMTNGLDNNIGDLNLTDAIIFPLITHSNRLTYDSNGDLANNIYDGGTNNGVPFTQLKPAIKVLAILKAIELKYSLTFSNDFFTTTNTAISNLYMWMHTKAGGLFTDQENRHLISDYVVGQSLVPAGVSILNSSISITPLTVRKMPTFDLSYTIRPSDQNLEYNLVINEGGSEFARFEGLTGDTKNGSAISDDVDKITVERGSYSAYIEVDSAGSFDVEITVTRNNRDLLKTKDSITLTTTLTTFSEAPITVMQHLPDMKIIDFLTGIFKMFNLTAFINDDGVVVVQTLDDFFASSTKVWDITKFVDSTQTQVDTTIPFRQIDLGYEGIDTFLANNFTRQNNKEWGKLEYLSEEKFEGDTYSIELPFEHMLYERLKDSTGGSKTNIQWGWYADEKQEGTSGMPLLFYAVKPTGGTISARNIAGTQVSITKPYMPSNSQAIGNILFSFGLQSQSLNFHAEVDEYTGVPNTKTLFKSYYETYIKDLFDVKKRLTSMSAFLPLSILQDLSLADHFKIFGNEYRINSISTNFETGVSDLELTNVVNNTALNTAPPASNVIIDTGGDDISSDSDVITADKFDETADDFVGDPEQDETGGDIIIGNDPVNTGTEPCEATKAVVSAGVNSSEIDRIIVRYNIEQAGTLCGQINIDEYGFLVSSTESDLDGTDIDVIKGRSGVDVYAFERSAGNQTLSGGEKSATITGLTDPETVYIRFYVRTNTLTTDDTADVISDVFSESTDVGAVTADGDTITVDDTDSVTVDSGDADGDGVADVLIENDFWFGLIGAGSDGFDTIPTIDDVQTGRGIYLAKPCGKRANAGIAHFNGSDSRPVVGDFIKSQFGNSTYGTASNAGFDGHTVSNYTVMATMDADSIESVGTQATGLVDEYIVIDTSTMSVVDVLKCQAISAPIPIGDLRLHVYAYTNAGALTASYYTNLIGTSDIRSALPPYYLRPVPAPYPNHLAVISTDGITVKQFPDPQDLIRVTHIDGNAVSTSFLGNSSQVFAGLASSQAYGIFYLIDKNNIIRCVMQIQLHGGRILSVAK